MRKTRRTKIVVETQRLLVVRSRGAGGSCEACGGRSRTVGLEEAAVLSGLSQREIVREVEAGSLHFKESEDGLLTVCLDTLLSLARGKDKGRGK